MYTRKSFLMGLAALALLGACASHAPAAKSVSAAPSVKKVLSVKQDAPAVSDLDTGRGALDYFIKFGSREEDNAPVHIASTAAGWEKPLLENWAADKKIRFDVTTRNFGHNAPGDLVAWARENQPGTDYLAETKIRKWGVKPHPKDSSRKIVFISLNHKLTDLKSGEVIVNRNCVRDTKDVPHKDAPTSYKLLKDNRALLKDTMERLTKACLDAAPPNA